MSGSRAQISWLVLAGGCLAGAEMARQGLWTGPAVGGIAAGGYTFWSVFWGLPPCWAWWRRHQRPIVSFVEHLVPGRSGAFWAGSLAANAMVFSVCIWLSLIGGGIVEFWRSRRAHAASP
jgi:hypothetical protein